MEVQHWSSLGAVSPQGWAPRAREPPTWWLSSRAMGCEAPGRLGAVQGVSDLAQLSVGELGAPQSIRNTVIASQEKRLPGGFSRGGHAASRLWPDRQPQPAVQQATPRIMQIIDNVSALLGDDLRKTIRPGAKVKIAASTFPS